MKIQIFDLGTGTRTIVPFKDLIPKDVVERVKEWGDTLGVGLQVTEIKDAGRFVTHYFSEQGYQVVDLQNRDAISFEPVARFFRDLELKGKVPKGLGDIPRESGTPDYFCYKAETNDWFFAEAKNQNDGIRMSQLNWFYNHRLPTKIVHAAEIGYLE
jgi:hypothetical protein